MEAKQTGEPILTLRKRLALETVNIGEEDSKTALSTLEGTFQVAFRTGCLWEVQESIFRKWERVSDERKLSILLRVDSGELSLDQMTQECARCKTLDVIMKSFCHLTGCKDWTEAQAKCGPYSTDERLYSFEKSFDLMLKDRSSSNSITKALFGVDEPELEGGKRKCASKANSLVQVLPPEFLDHIDSARAYKEAKEAGRAVPVPDQNYKHWVKEGSLQSVKWDVFHGDKSQQVINKLLGYFSREDDWVLDLCVGSGTTLVCALQGGRNCVAVELDKRQFMYLASCVYNMKKLPNADSEVTRGHKHSKDVAPPTCDGEASLVDMSVPETVDDVIRLEKDQVSGSAGTGGNEADDGTEDPEGIDPGVHAEEAEEAEEEVPEHELHLGQERIVPVSIVEE
ncbi:hypothetical protein R1sor_016912 [Riccia sorocarpa]|uniref:DNA methylase N-4/N-6 domain-containing protein n=1 Tax=Riccia sorocarpa TaxID=122646 RepID=A0ABD3HG77_9MARC